MTRKISPEPRLFPDHEPILVCPTCAVHTVHTMPVEGQYTCLTCATVHGVTPLRKVHHDVEPIWCPTCRVPAGSPMWAPVQGRQQCRVCLTWIPVVTPQGSGAESPYTTPG